MSKSKKEKLTRLVLAGLTTAFIGGSVCYGPTAEAKDAVTIDGESSLPMTGINQMTPFNLWRLSDSTLYDALVINGVPTTWTGWDFAGYAKNGGSGTYPAVTVTMTNGKLNNLYGILITGSATGNVQNATVNISGGTVDQVIGGSGVGGYKVTNNKVSISGTATINNLIRGGYIPTGSSTTVSEANENEIKIEGGTIKKNVYGGASDDTDNAVNMTKNTVTVTGGTIDSGVNIHGAWSSKGLASENSVTIDIDNKGGTFGGSNTIYGGHSNSGDVTKNVVDIKTGTVSSVYGGHTENGNAGGENKGNTVQMTGGTVNGDIFGGYAQGGVATYNSIEISGGKATANIRGGQGYTTGATSYNEVSISKDATVGTDTGNSVLGGYSTTGNATYNNVKVSGGEVKGWIAAGIAETGTNQQVYHNTTEITGGTIGNTVYGGRARSSGGVASTNFVDISGDNTVINAKVIGGDTVKGTSTSNKVTISGNAQIKNAVYGGSSGDNTNAGNATENTVEIKGGTIGDGSGADDSGTVYGGYTKTGNAASNTVTMTGGKVTGKFALNGGWAETSGNADSNKVTISGGIVEKSVRGGRSYGDNNQANGNTVTISGTAQIKADIMAGRATGLQNATAYTANDNIVNINGGTFGETSRIFGGLAGWSGSEIENGTTANNNIVNINVATKVNGIVGGFGQTSTGNTLNLGATGINVGASGVTYTQIIGISKDLAFASGKTVLNSTGAVTGVGTLDISGATVLTGSTAPGTMTLLHGQNNNFSSLNLKYSGGTKAIGTGIVVKENAEAKDTENNVTLSYKNTHTVALADTDSKVNYTITNNVKGITPGVVTWVANGTARSGAGYIYDNNTAIDASGLSFAIANNDKAALASGSTMTLLGGASNLAGKTVTGKDRSQTVDYSAANGTALAGTLKGTVSTTADKVNYTATSMTLDKVNLAGWNGTASAVPTGWTANLQANSITAADFTAPTIDAGTVKNILTTSTDKYFNDNQITGAMKYKADTPSKDTVAGVTITGAESRGVKTSADGRNLVYARSNFNVTDISMGEMEWGKGRTMSAKGHDFADGATINASNLSFNFTDTDKEALAKGSQMALLSGASNLAGKTVTGKDRSQTMDYSAANGTTLTGTLQGTVSTTADKVNYTATSMTLDKVNLAGWNGTASAVPTGWTAAGGLSVSGTGFMAPSQSLGASTNILTTTTEGFFNGVTVAEDLQNIATNYSRAENNITISGKELSNVKGADKNLVYSSDKAAIDKVAIGAVTYQKGATLMDGSGAVYDYSEIKSLDTSYYSMNMTDDQAKTAQANDSMTLLKGNSTLGDIEAKDVAARDYSYAPKQGVNVDASVSGNVSAAGGSVLYTVGSNRATNLSFEGLKWSDTYNRPDSEVSYSSALVNAINISFTGVTSLSTGDTMLLVSNYGDSVRKTRGDSFTLGELTGKGHAYYENGSLYYMVDKGTTSEPSPDVPATGGTETLDGGTTDKDVIGGQAEGKGDSTKNEVDVKNGAKVQVNADGTGGDVTGGTSEEGKSEGNKATVSEKSEVDGGVTGARTDSGDATNNEATVTGESTVGLEEGGVIGAQSQSGTTTGNTATVENSTVNGDVGGGLSNKGGVIGNNASIRGSEVKPNEKYGDNSADVYGGQSKSGDAKKNEATVDNSKVVKGDVTGGGSESGTSEENKATVNNKSTVTGNVMGGQTEKGNANKNEANVDGGSTVTGNVLGGRSDSGQAEGNKAQVKGDSTVEGNVAGGQTNSGTASKNEASVDSSTVTGDISGAGTTSGNAEGNTATVQGSENIKGNVTGAYTTSGNTEGNKADVKGSSTVTGNVMGSKTDSGTANKNEATVDGSTINEGDVTGAGTRTGNAQGNTATVSGSSTVNGNVFGASSESGNTEGNKADVKGSSKVTGSVVGSQTEKGTASKNEANVEGSTVSSDVAGAVTTSGTTEGNKANVRGGSTIDGKVLGSQTDSGTASMNEASVEGSIVHSDVAGASSNSGNTEGNKADVKGGSTIYGSVLGSQTDSGTANKNEATVDGSTVTGNVGGANTNTGAAEGNTATVSGNSSINGNVAGAKSTSGAVTLNTANVTGGSVAGSVYGGYSESGSASNNTVSVNKTAVGTDTSDGNVYGGKTDGTEAADTNTVTLDGNADVKGGVYGGYSAKGTADGNTVTVKDATIRDYVYGGKSLNKSANDSVFFRNGEVLGIIGGGCKESINNTAELTEGTVKEHVLGGFAEETATGNTVNVTGGTVTGSVIGGYGGTKAANDNTVTLSGGTVQGENITSTVLGVTIAGGVYGGYSESGTTQNNTVNLYGTADISATSLFGGNREATGNVLNIGATLNGTPSTWTGGGQMVKNISNFETINYSVVPWSTSTAAVAITDGSTSDLSAATVSASNVTFTGVKTLSVNDSMTLLDQSKAASKATQVTADSAFTLGMSAEGTGKVTLDDNGNVVYNVKSVKASEQTHNTVMGAEATMTALSVGNEFIGDAIKGLGLEANTGTDGVAAYAKLGGGKLRQETGSHVDVNTWNAILGVGHKNVKKQSSFEYGAFFEYGNGNYTTYNDAAQPGDGSTRYTGGGLLAKWYAPKGFYVEGSLRAGTVHENANNLLRDSMGNAYGYNTDTNYFGFHVGVGRELKLDKNSSLDVYAKYFYNRRNGTDFTVDGADYSLDAVTSSLVRVGTRYTERNDRWNFYGGLAYEYEMDGKANGRVNGLSIRGADIGGGRVRGEIGTFMRPSADNPWGVDLNLTCFVGKKQGVMGSVSVAYTF